MGKQSTPNTLDEAVKELVSRIRAIENLQNTIDEKWGVLLHVSNIYYSQWSETKGEVIVRRGIEELEKAFGKEAKSESCFRDVKKLRHYGVEFTQYADDKTKTFVKAGKKPPKVVIVEDDAE